jgi:hypothetical protein
MLQRWQTQPSRHKGVASTLVEAAGAQVRTLLAIRDLPELVVVSSPSRLLVVEPVDEEPSSCAEVEATPGCAA